MPSFSALADVAASFDPQVGLHFHLECFICGPADVRPSPFEGWATVSTIFQRRPDGCRYAVARIVPIKHIRVSAQRDVVEAGDAPAGDFLCWDFFDDVFTKGSPLRNRGLLPAPTPKWQSPHLDGLIMKVMALYGRD